MGYYCTVPQCTSLAGKTKNVKFHRFPRDVTMADKWNVILKRGKPYTKYSKVCSLHFTQADYNVTTMGQWKTLSKDALPSQNLPKLNPDGTVMVIRKSRTVKYKESKKEEHSEKMGWQMYTQGITSNHHDAPHADPNSLSHRLQNLAALANQISPQHQNHQGPKPKKQDAFIQTDPQTEDDDTQHNNSYSETSEKSFTSEQIDRYSVNASYQKDQYDSRKNYETPKDYTKSSEDYIPQTNEEYNKEAEKYALDRNMHSNGYEKLDSGYQKGENGYGKMPVYGGAEYQREYGYAGQEYNSVEMLKNQQNNLHLLQEPPHRLNENQNFFAEGHIKQEIDISNDDDKYLYERKEQINGERGAYGDRRLLDQLQNQLKQEPDAQSGCESVLQPQTSPYYPPNGHNPSTAGYYGARPGPELLIAKQNALAAHSQLWQNTIKRPFFYSDTAHYNTPPLLHTRYEDLTRILQ